MPFNTDTQIYNDNRNLHPPTDARLLTGCIVGSASELSNQIRLIEAQTVDQVSSRSLTQCLFRWNIQI